MIGLNRFFPNSNHDTATNIGPIGFDLGNDRLNMLQMEWVNGGLRIRAAVSTPYPCSREELIAQPARLATYIKETLNTQSFAGKKIVACMPYGDDLKLVNIDFRKVPEESDQNAIIRELRERYGNELEQSVVDYLLIRSNDNGHSERSALVAIAKRQSVLSYLDLIRKAGFEAMALDIGPAALARVISALDKEKSIRTYY
jgi:type IV pilus assembly protein PilM